MPVDFLHIRARIDNGFYKVMSKQTYGSLTIVPIRLVPNRGFRGELELRHRYKSKDKEIQFFYELWESDTGGQYVVYLFLDKAHRTMRLQAAVEISANLVDIMEPVDYHFNKHEDLLVKVFHAVAEDSIFQDGPVFQFSRKDLEPRTYIICEDTLKGLKEHVWPSFGVPGANDGFTVSALIDALSPLLN